MVRNRTTVKPGLFLQPFVVSQLSGRLIERIVEGSEVTPAEYAVTSWLNVVGSATPGDISRVLGITPTTLSAMIERLVRKKQIKRVRNPDDGRSYLLEPTARGKATNARNGARFQETLAELRGNLEGPPEEILEAMRTLEEGLRKTLGEGRP
jgi:DNA-binding MarR family transcriptional regulator